MKITMRTRAGDHVVECLLKGDCMNRSIAARTRLMSPPMNSVLLDCNASSRTVRIWEGWRDVPRPTRIAIGLAS